MDAGLGLYRPNPRQILAIVPRAREISGDSPTAPESGSAADEITSACLRSVELLESVASFDICRNCGPYSIPDVAIIPTSVLTSAHVW